MNKFLNILKFILLFVLIVLNYLALKNEITIQGFNHLLYWIFIGIFCIISIKDLVKKNLITNNKTYNFLCIIIFLIMNVIFLRALYDPHFFYNNLALMNELDNYYISLYGDTGGMPIDIDCINFFIKQNINYFLVMFILLFLYRKLNFKEDTN